MPTGSTRSVGPPGGVSTVTFYPSFRVPRETLSDGLTTGCAEAWGSDVQEADVLRIPGDKGSARLDVLPHQHAEQLVGGRGVVEGDLQQDPFVGIHGRVPELAVIHLAEALEALDGLFLGQLAARGLSGLDETVTFAVGVGVLEVVLAPLDL